MYNKETAEKEIKWLLRSILEDIKDGHTVNIGRMLNRALVKLSVLNKSSVTPQHPMTFKPEEVKTLIFKYFDGTGLIPSS